MATAPVEQTIIREHGVEVHTRHPDAYQTMTGQRLENVGDPSFKEPTGPVVVPLARPGGASSGFDLTARRKMLVDPDTNGVVVDMGKLTKEQIAAAVQESYSSTHVDARGAALAAMRHLNATAQAQSTAPVAAVAAAVPAVPADPAAPPTRIAANLAAAFRSPMAAMPQASGAPVVTAVAAPPHRVQFELTDPRFGTSERSARYHAVLEERSTLVLIYDRRYDGERYFPDQLSETFLARVDDGAAVYRLLSLGVRYVFDNYEHCPLLITDKALITGE